MKRPKNAYCVLCPFTVYLNGCCGEYKAQNSALIPSLSLIWASQSGQATMFSCHLDSGTVSGQLKSSHVQLTKAWTVISLPERRCENNLPLSSWSSVPSDDIWSSQWGTLGSPWDTGTDGRTDGLIDWLIDGCGAERPNPAVLSLGWPKTTGVDNWSIKTYLSFCCFVSSLLL